MSCAGADGGQPADAIGEPARERRGHVHPGEMERDGQADGSHLMPLIVEVHRRGRRGGDHHELAHHQRGERDLDAHVRHELAERAGGRGGRRRCAHLAAGARLLLARDGERVGAQERRDEEPGEAVARHAHEEGARGGGDAEPGAHAQRGVHQIRADDGSDGGAPHDDAHGAAAPRGRGDIGSGIAGEEIRRAAHAEQRHAGEHDREAPPDDAEHAEHGAGAGEGIAEREPGPASRSGHETRQRPARERGAERAHPDGKTGPGVGAGDAGGEDTADGEADGMAGAAADLRHEEGGHELGAARDAARRRCRSGHRRERMR